VARRAGAVTILVAAATIGAANAGATTGHPTSRALVESGPVVVLDDSCGAHALEARVTISRLEFSPAQPVTVHATVRNVGSSPCTVAGTPQGPTTAIGPCSSLSLEVENRHGTNLWPGNAAYGCPMLSVAHLPAGGHFSATGSWDQKTAVGSRQVPPGRYRLIVGDSLSFTISIR
jgi:hypothetical protein